MSPKELPGQVEDDGVRRASTINQLVHVVRPSSKIEIGVAILFFAFFATPYLLTAMNGRSYRSGFTVLSDQQQRNIFAFPYQIEPEGAQKRRSYNFSLDEILEETATPEKTVIITSLNAAWAKNNTMIDLFLESFHKGNGTASLLRHLIIVAFDQKAFNRCMSIHEYCFKIETPGLDFSQEEVYMTPDFVKMMWRRIQFLETVLKKGYSFVFTDADILWLRNPFQRLKAAGIERQQMDMAMSCDRFNGHPFDALHNMANTGFIYARSTNRTSAAFNYWYGAREKHPGEKEQDVFEAIKVERPFRRIRLRWEFLDTQYFGGFCEMQNTDLAKVVTMHANCCKGLEAKLSDLRVVLEAWDEFRRQPPVNSSVPPPHFQPAWACPRSWFPPADSPNS